MELKQTNTIKKKTLTEKDDIFRNNQKLSSCYNGGYAPPSWSETPMTNCKNYKLCRVFYNIEDEITDIEKLVYYSSLVIPNHLVKKL